MDSCYTGDHTAEDHIHTDITCNTEELRRKFRLGTGDKNYWVRRWCGWGLNNLYFVHRSLPFNRKRYANLWFLSADHVRVTDDAWIAETSKYGPCSSFWMQYLLLQELFKIYFYFTADYVVSCGDRKKSPRTSSIVQIIFCFSPLRSEDIFWIIRNFYLVKTLVLDHPRFNPFWFLLIPSSLYIDCLIIFKKLQLCYSLVFITRSCQDHWWGFNSRNFEVCSLFLCNCNSCSWRNSLRFITL